MSSRARWFGSVALAVAAAAAQGQTTDAVALLDALDAARFGASPRPATESLVIHGTFSLDIGGFSKDQPLKGSVEILFDGPNIREVSDYGTFGRVDMGINGDLCWEVHVAFGNRIEHGDAAATMRRLMALVRWPGWRAQYESGAIVGTERIDGRACDVLRLKPKSGPSEVWYLDQETHLPRRIEMTVFLMNESATAQQDFFEWQRVDGVAYPKTHRVTCGEAVGNYVYDRVAHGERIDPQRFAIPEAITKLAAEEPAAEAPAPGWQVLVREPQPVASVRVRVRAAEVSKALAEILPEVSAYASEIGAQTTAAPFCRYHSEADGMVDLEAGVQVTKPVPAKGRIQPSEIPGGRTAIAFHFGPYDKLEGARTGLRRWLDEQHLVPRGGVIEIFWSDPGQERDPKEWRTQLLWPVE